MPASEILRAIITKGSLKQVTLTKTVGQTSGHPLLTVRKKIFFSSAVLHFLGFFHVVNKGSSHIMSTKLA